MTRRRRLAWLVSTLTVAAACNGIVGNSEVSLWDGGADDGDGTLPDALGAARDAAVGDAGPGRTDAGGGAGAGDAGVGATRDAIADGSVSTNDAGAAADAADAADAACTTGESGCSGAQRQKCIDGVWLDNGVPCSGTAPACLAGSCVACDPSAVQCVGQQPQTCDATGAWQDAGAACSGAAPICLAPACVACSPGAMRCQDQQPQKCDMAGDWQNNGAACPVNQTCLPSSGACGGVCGPTQTDCTAGTQGAPETCGSDGMWVIKAACPYVCSQGECTGMCLPASTRCSAATGDAGTVSVQMCSTDGLAWVSQITCQVCNAGVSAPTYAACGSCAGVPTCMVEHTVAYGIQCGCP